MRITTLACRYAAAIFGAARDADAIDNIESDLGLVTFSLQTMPRLREALSHPLVSAADKKKIVTEVFKAEINPITVAFISLLIDKRRGDLLDQVQQEYVRLANDYRGVVPAFVTSAVPLTENEKKLLRQKLDAFTGKKVELAVEEDPDLIAGVTVRIGDNVMDGSVRGYLASLKTRLLGK